MANRYTENQIKDVAELLRKYYLGIAYGSGYSAGIAGDFADLFAADNPKCCIHCGYIKGATEICDSADGQLRDEHTFEYGFDRDEFLTACGLEREA